MQTAAAYLRVSTDEQVEHGISLPAQKSRLLAYAQAQGWELYDYYIDDGYSGKSLDRPAMQRMMDDAQNKKFNYIIVIKLDRLSRRQKDVLYLLEDILEPNNVGFKSVTEPFDTTTPFGKASIGMMAVFAQLERETIVERVKMAKKEAAKQGRFGGGGTPFGYSYDLAKKMLMIDYEYSPTVELIYSLYESGKYGFRLLANDLIRRNISSPAGGVWYKDTVKKILSNPTYAGYIHRRTELSEGKHQSIIDRDRWHRVQDMISGGYVPRPKKDSDNLLTGVIFCGRCEARMRFKTQTRRNANDPLKDRAQKYYICYSRAGYDRMVKDPDCQLPFVHVEYANKVVIEHLTKLSLSPSLLKESADQALKKRSKSTSMQELNAATKELSLIRKKIERWNTAFETGAIEIDDLMQRTKDLREKRVALEKSIDEMQRLVSEENKSLITTQEVIDLVRQFHLIWEDATPDEQRVIIASLVDKVLVYDTDRIEVLLNL